MEQQEQGAAQETVQNAETAETKEAAVQMTVSNPLKATEAGVPGRPENTMAEASTGETAEENVRSRELNYFIHNVENPDTRMYIQTRVVEQMNYYSNQSKACKKQYFRFTTVSILLGALIPIASIFSDSSTLMKVVIASLGSAVTAINAYLALYNSKDFWITYRNTRETLLRTLYYYFNKTNMFGKDRSGKEMDQADRDKLLIQYCEKEMASENGSWRSTVEE